MPDLPDIYCHYALRAQVADIVDKLPPDIYAQAFKEYGDMVDDDDNTFRAVHEVEYFISSSHEDLVKNVSVTFSFTDADGAEYEIDTITDDPELEGAYEAYDLPPGVVSADEEGNAVTYGVRRTAIDHERLPDEAQRLLDLLQFEHVITDPESGEALELVPLSEDVRRALGMLAALQKGLSIIK
jgi:hypothetical protein